MQARILKCTGHDYCKDDAAISSYFKKRFLVMLSNRIRFDSEKFGAQALIRESTVDWVNVSTHVQLTESFAVSRTELSLQDFYVHADDLTALEDSTAFRLLPGKTRIREGSPDEIMGLFIEHDANQIVVERTIVTFLDVLAAIGGLESTLASFFSLLMVVFNHNSLSNFLSARLFKMTYFTDPQH